MTCIAAVADGRTVWIGGDSAGTDIYDSALLLGVHREPKVWQQGPLVFGACGSFRVAQVLRWHLELPHLADDTDPLAYLSGPLAAAMREVLAMHGTLSVWEADTTEQLTGSSLVVGFAGRVFEVFEDFGAGELVNGYAAVGCGASLAYGALAATEGLRLGARRRLELALAAAERHSAGVRGPMTVLRAPA